MTATMGTLTALVEFYPSSTGHFFLNGGLGTALIEVADGVASSSESGAGSVLGLGYDVRVGRDANITPYLNGVVGAFDNGGSMKFSQIGIGFSWH